MSENNLTICSCGLMLPDKHLQANTRYNSSGECLELFDELTAINLNHSRPDFIHQLAVDAYAAQHPGDNMKTIGIAFALIGLCLAAEHGFSGRQVQLVHMKIPKQQWERLPSPTQKASITVKDVLMADFYLQREGYIKKWAASVWNIWTNEHQWIRNKVKELIV